jgi:N-acetylmuramoyl-L-alanine amidase
MKVFISVGHGGRDPGAVANGFRESDLNLSVAKACVKELRRHNIEVMMSRNSDIDDDVNRQVRLAREFNSNLAVDIHFNAFNGNARGFEVFHSINPRPNEINLSRNIEREFVSLGMPTRGLKTRVGSNNTDFFGFIRMLDIPSIIVECAFIDNLQDLQFFNTSEKQKAMGIATAKGILKTMGVDILNPAEEEGDEYMITRLEVTKNGKNITTNNIFHNGKNYVELRDYEESYGNKVTYDGNINITNSSNNTNDVRFNIDGNKFEIDGQMINDANLVRARDLLENLGYKVTWENNTVVGTIKSNN